MMMKFAIDNMKKMILCFIYMVLMCMCCYNVGCISKDCQHCDADSIKAFTYSGYLRNEKEICIISSKQDVNEMCNLLYNEKELKTTKFVPNVIIIVYKQNSNDTLLVNNSVIKNKGVTWICNNNIEELLHETGGTVP